MGGTLRGAGEESAARCFWGVLVEGVGVAMAAVVAPDARGERGTVGDSIWGLLSQGAVRHG